MSHGPVLSRGRSAVLIFNHINMRNFLSSCSNLILLLAAVWVSSNITSCLVTQHICGQGR